MYDPQKLKEGYPIPAPQEADLQRTLCLCSQLQQTLAACPPQGMARFLFRQLRFITKKMWALQLLFFCLFAAFAEFWARQPGLQPQLLPLLSALSPFWGLLNLVDLTRFYCPGMLEIELCTRHGLHRVTAARLFLFGLSDALFCLLSCLVFCLRTGSRLPAVLTLCLAPFCLMCCCCLLLLQLVQVQFFPAAALLLGGVVSASALLCGRLPLQAALLPLWRRVGALSLLLSIPLARRFLRRLGEPPAAALPGRTGPSK